MHSLAMLFGSLGLVFLGVFIGEDNKVREDRHNPICERRHLEGANKIFLYAALLLIGFAILTGVSAVTGMVILFGTLVMSAVID